MVNNVGIICDVMMCMMIEEQFDQVIVVYLKGIWNGIWLVVVIMWECKWGVIVNMFLVLGKVGMVG